MMKLQFVNSDTDMIVPNIAAEEAELETKSVPKYLEDSINYKRNWFAMHVFANSLSSSSFRERLIKYETNDRRALETDWAISSNDLVKASFSVIEDQKPEVKRELYRMLLRKILEHKTIDKEESC